MARGERREGGVKGMKNTSAACILHLQTSRENMQKCAWLGESENKASSCTSLHPKWREWLPPPPVPVQLAILLARAGEGAFGSVTFWVPR